MRVIKRTGTYEEVSFDKVLTRLRNLSNNLTVDYYDITQKVCGRIYDLVKTCELDELAAHICSSLVLEHPDYGVLASRIIISNHHKNTSPSFSETIQNLYQNGNLVSDQLYELVMNNKEKLNSYLDYTRDYTLDYFGFKTLERSYLLKVNAKTTERPQQMFMRVALGIHGEDLKDALQTYDLMSLKYFTHATPTLFNSGTSRPQNSSCFLLHMNDDSVSGIFSSLHECALISKYAGGIGIHIHNVRCKGSRIRGTNGISSGILPMLRVFNNTARYIDQAGRRAGSIAVYLEPWHADVFEFLEMKKPHGHEEERARDLFYALWIPDLFMKRVKEGGQWSLMCPDVCKRLSDCWGDEFERLYESYEASGTFIKQVPAQTLWFKILESQIETGTPYLLYKDAVNSKSNQQNLGTIKSSNLCAEITEFTSPDEIAVCNLASICLPTFIQDNKFNFERLHAIAKVVTKNLNKIIDVNFYPHDKARLSNAKHRPIGIGVQGLADTFAILKLAFESDQARELNKMIFETIYHGALESSMELSKKHGSTYSTFEGSPTSRGILQFDLWNKEPINDRYDWISLKNDIVKYGLMNSLLLAPMPTASTSQIMGFNEAFEPFTSNIYKRKTMAGEFILVNKYLVSDLMKLDLWTRDLRNKIIVNEGSVQKIKEIPEHIREIYKTVWEIKQKNIIDLAADRGIYVCQSQSMNLFMEDPDFKKLSSMHFYAWQQGLKTGMYYLRTKPRAKVQQFTIEPEKNNLRGGNLKCTDEICTTCSS